MINKNVKCKFPVGNLMHKFSFGNGYTICYRPFELGGHEIHVWATKPIRYKCLDLMNSIGGTWWTYIDLGNIKAINLAIKCGFEFVKQFTVKSEIDGKVHEMNLYKRSL